MTSVRPTDTSSDNPELRHKIEGQPAGFRPLTALEQRVLRKTGRAALYFIGYEGDADDDPIKIGYTFDLRQRLVQYRTQSWRAVIVHDVLYTVSVFNILQEREIKRALEEEDFARCNAVASEFSSTHVAGVEQALHNRLKDLSLHARGEWFYGGVEFLVNEAKRLIREDLGGEYLTHKSMLRMIHSWKNEAGLR